MKGPAHHLGERERARAGPTFRDGDTFQLQRLRAALLEQLEPQITLALQVAVLLAAGHQNAAICRQLGCSLPDFTQARLRLKRAVARLDLGDARGPLADDF